LRDADSNGFDEIVRVIEEGQDGVTDVIDELHAILNKLLLERLRQAKKEKYFWNRLDKTKEQSLPTSVPGRMPKISSRPSPKNPSALDDADHTDLSLLMEQGSEHTVVFAGTDSGLVTMEETVGVSKKRLLVHMNRYAPLLGKSTGA
ncbi:hypothetical protein BGZ65_007551, partial [Modicella reniformis]